MSSLDIVELNILMQLGVIIGPNLPLEDMASIK